MFSRVSVPQSDPPRSPRETLPTMYDLPSEDSGIISCRIMMSGVQEGVPFSILLGNDWGCQWVSPVSQQLRHRQSCGDDVARDSKR
ncbi:MAG: hypothetical protein AAFX78_04380 [Cyanobacteria bacterium J06638_20]